MAINKAAIKEVCTFVEIQEFDSVVVILLDSSTDRIMNWWHFSGHPNTLTSSDLSARAQQMVAHTAEIMKTDVNVGRPMNYTGPRISIPSAKDRNATTKASPSYIYLCGVILSIVRLGGKRLYLSMWLNRTEFGISLSWGNGLTIWLGPFSFTAHYQN